MKTRYLVIAALVITVALLISAFSLSSSRKASESPSAQIPQDIRQARLFELVQGRAILASSSVPGVSQPHIYYLADVIPAVISAGIRQAHLYDLEQGEGLSSVSSYADVSQPHIYYLVQVTGALSPAGLRQAHLYDLTH
jgi:hypothetical protein